MRKRTAFWGVEGRSSIKLRDDVKDIFTYISLLELKVVKDIKADQFSSDDAAKEIGKLCCCGVFNPVRGAGLLTARLRNRKPDQ